MFQLGRLLGVSADIRVLKRVFMIALWYRRSTKTSKIIGIFAEMAL
jgi:hypothetical protein